MSLDKIVEKQKEGSVSLNPARDTSANHISTRNNIDNK